jgi:hypothetical protein
MGKVVGGRAVIEFLPGAGTLVPATALYFRRGDLQPLAKGETVAALAAAVLDGAARLAPRPPLAVRDVLAAAQPPAYLFQPAIGPRGNATLLLIRLHAQTNTPHALP